MPFDTLDPYEGRRRTLDAMSAFAGVPGVQGDEAERRRQQTASMDDYLRRAGVGPERQMRIDPETASAALDAIARNPAPAAPNPATGLRTQTVTTGSGTTAFDFDAGGRLVNPAGRAVGGGPADRMTADEIGRVMDQMFKANRSRLGPDAAGSWELDPQNARLSAAYRADIARNAAEATSAQLQNLLGHRQAEISRQTAADQQANALAIEKLREQGQMDRQKFQYGPEAQAATEKALALKAFHEAVAQNPAMAGPLRQAILGGGSGTPAPAGPGADAGKPLGDVQTGPNYLQRFYHNLGALGPNIATGAGDSWLERFLNTRVGIRPDLLGNYENSPYLRPLGVYNNQGR